MIRWNIQRWGNVHSFLFAGLLTAGIVTTAAESAHASSGGGFNRTGSMNAARLYHTATLLANGQVLVAGGENYTDGFLASTELYNPATGKWTLTGGMTTPRWGHQAVVLQNGQVLVAGGGNDSTCCGKPDLASAELYSPATGKWTATGSMTTGRILFSLVLLANGKVLAAGGNAGNQYLSSAELYDPATGTWTPTGSMTATNIFPGAVLLQNGQAFVIPNDNLYNPTTATWSATTKGGGWAPVALLSSGKVFVGMGDALYDPTTAQWTTFAAPPCTTGKQVCGSAGALLATGKVLVAGGTVEVPGSPYPTQETIKSAALWDPSTLGWASAGDLNVSRTQETMTVLLNGQALVAGGESFDKSQGRMVPVADAELYKP